jgi:hypothetical protein
MKHISLAVLVSGTIVLVASGCGGSAESASKSTHTTESANLAKNSTNSGTALTKTELITKADRICQRVNAQVAPFHGSTPQYFGRVAPQIAGYEQTAIGSLSKLIPPTSMESDWKQMLQDQQTITQHTLKFGQYAKVNDSSGMRAELSILKGAQRDLLVTAKRNGFQVCSHTV